MERTKENDKKILNKIEKIINSDYPENIRLNTIFDLLLKKIAGNQELVFKKRIRVKNVQVE